MKRVRLIAFLLLSAVLLCACGETTAPNDHSSAQSTASGEPVLPGEESGSSDPGTGIEPEEGFIKDPGTEFTDRDYRTDYDESECIRIVFSADGVQASSSAVQVNGTKAVLTGEATYLVSGSCPDGMLVVEADKKDKIRIVLNGLTLTSKTSAALYIKKADKVFVTLAPGSKNTLANGGTFTAIDSNNIDGAIFAKDDLTFNGSGSLTVSSEGGHGIVAKDDLIFTGGTYEITASGHGMDVNDSLRTDHASVTICSGKDGIHVDSDDESLGYVYVGSGTFAIDAQGDGVSASSFVQIRSGEFAVTTGGGSTNGAKKTSENWGGFPGRPGGFPGGPGGFGKTGTDSASSSDSESIKGFKASDLLIEGGSLKIDSADDAIHANGTVRIKAGSLDIKTGDDAIHADDTLTISGGVILIRESYEGLEALHVVISGGDITLTATDDGINAAGGTDGSGTGGNRGGDKFGGHGPGGSSGSVGSIVISDGKISVTAYGDGLDANGTIEISGGDITVTGPTVGDTATIDYDVSGTITGGRFIGTGAIGMAQSFSQSTQGVIAISTGNQKAGTTVRVTDKDGKVVLEYAPALDYAVFIYSDPALKKGEKYTVTIGDNAGDFTAK